MNILVTTCDKQLHCLPPFSYLFNKYWSKEQPVTVMGFKEPDFELPENFSFYSVGEQDDYPFDKWSDAVLKFLDDHPDWEQFVLMLEDYFLVRRVNVQAVIYIEEIMKNNPAIIRGDLCADRLYSAGALDYGYYKTLDIIKSDPDSQYHMSLWCSMWNKNLFREIVIPGESPHDVEIYGTARLKEHGDHLLSIGTRQYPVRHITAYKFSEPEHVNLNGLRNDDQMIVKQMLNEFAKAV